jgi:hypothetical protein
MNEEPIPWLNRSERDPYADYYDDQTKTIIHEQAR